MKLLINIDNQNIKNYYENHTTFNPGDSGLDLFCPEDITISPGETVFINFGIKCEMLDGEKNKSWWLIPRSSISKTSLRMANSIGLMDAGYRGDVIAAVDNIKQEEYKIEKGQRLFQICTATLEEIEFELVDSLSSTIRGEGGFGSTGL